MTNAASAINSFLPAQDACSSVSQSEDPVFILSSAQLQEIITKAIQPLKQEIARDRKEIAALRDQLSSLEKDRDVLSDNQLIQLRLIHELKEKVNQESQSPATTTKKTTEHIDDLYRLMIEDKTAQVSIAKAARLLGISKERMRQLKPIILKDDRFEIGWASVAGRKGTVIRIHKFL